MTARQKAISVGEALAKLMPAFCQRLRAAGGESEQLMVSELRVDDRVLVRPGEVIPCDGEVEEGVSNADESLLTGESLPVKKQAGDAVTGGSLNMESPLVVRVKAVGEETRLSAIIRLMERAAAEKPGIVVLADRVAQWFVLVLLVVAALTAVVWYGVDGERALWITVSVLVVTCPCALALATPIALTVASGALAKEGLLVTRGHALETLARATHFVFDKTGTLTVGKLRLLEIAPVSTMDADTALGLAASLEAWSEHPLARALCQAAKERLADAPPSAAEVIAETGQGLRGRVAGREVYIGRPDYVFAHTDVAHWPEGWQAAGDTVLALGESGGEDGRRALLAFFRLGDALRPEAAALIRDLHAAGRRTLLMSGDAAPVVARVAAELGVDVAEGDMSPQDKRDAVSRLQAAGAVVAMVGDGVNDAPVLAQAQVSIAMGSGAQLARAQADLVLLAESPGRLASGFRKSRFTLAVIRQNLAWAFLYNLLALPLAVSGHVTPWAAGIGMSASSLLVVLNALRIQKKET
jgi:Cu2+-exporting ATPase